MGRWAFPRRPALRRPAWRWLASGRRGRCLTVTASRDARPSGDPEAAAEAEGRDFSALTISYKALLYDTGIPSPDGSRRPFSGDPDDIAGDIRTFAGIGVHELIFDFRGQSIAESFERLQRFAAEVIPLVDG